MFAGHESAGSNNLKVFAMPRMMDYLTTNGPWDQLLRYSNIVLQALRDDEKTAVGESLVDFAYLDATFFDDNELPGRDMSKIPHPRLFDSMQRFSKLAVTEQSKVRFFHINHSNRVRFEDSEERRLMNELNFSLAGQNERVCLD